MKIVAHSESHIVELEDGSKWRIFPGDLDITLLWLPETDLTLLPIADDIASHVLLSEDGPVRAVPADRCWPEADAKHYLANS